MARGFEEVFCAVRRCKFTCDVDVWIELWITVVMTDKMTEASQLDKLANAAPSLAQAQELAAQADRLRGFKKSVRVLGLPFSRN